MSVRTDKTRYCLIFFATFVINLITSGIFRAQGLLFVEFIKNYDVDRKLAAIPFSVRIAIRNFAAPAIGIIGQKYGITTVTVIGGILGSLSAGLCYFATDMVWMTTIWGGMNGATLAMIHVFPHILISQYFDQHEKFTARILFSAGPVSAFLLPAVLEFLLKVYSMHSTFVILAGLFLHVIPAGMLLEKPLLFNTDTIKKSQEIEDSINVMENECTNASKYRKASSSKVKWDCGIQGATDKMYDFTSYQYILHNAHCKRNSLAIKRSHSHGSLMVQAHLNNLKLTTMFPRVSSIELNCKTFHKRPPENIYDVDIEYLKRQSDLVYHMLSMEIPNVEISYRAILLEVEQDDLWHPEQNEILQEIESIYRHIGNSVEIDEISSSTEKPNGPYLRKDLLNGALSINKKTESLRAVKRYLKTYKERGLQQLGKIRSAPNMSNIYNEIARKDYVLTKLKELCNGNEIRIISQLSQYNPKGVLRVLFQLRTLYNLYNDLECCDKREEPTEIVVETGDICSQRKDSCDTTDFNKGQNSVEKIEDYHTNLFKVHIMTAIELHQTLIFLLMCCTRVACFVIFVSMYITLVDFGRDKGLEIKDGKYIIVVLSLGDLVGRLSFGWITDKEYASISKYMFVCMVLQGLTLISIPLMTSTWTFLPSFVLIGLFQGSLYVKHPVLIKIFQTATAINSHWMHGNFYWTFIVTLTLIYWILSR